MVKAKEDKSLEKVRKNVGSLDAGALDKLFDLYATWIKAGASSMIQSYGSTLATADLIHSMGLMTDRTFSSIVIVQDIFAGIAGVEGIISAIFGGNALQPVLKSYVDASGRFAKDSPEEKGLQAALTSAITGAVEDVGLTLG